MVLFGGWGMDGVLFMRTDGLDGWVVVSFGTGRRKGDGGRVRSNEWDKTRWDETG